MGMTSITKSQYVPRGSSREPFGGSLGQFKDLPRSAMVTFRWAARAHCCGIWTDRPANRWTRDPPPPPALLSPPGSKSFREKSGLANRNNYYGSNRAVRVIKAIWFQRAKSNCGSKNAFFFNKQFFFCFFSSKKAAGFLLFLSKKSVTHEKSVIHENP